MAYQEIGETRSAMANDLAKKIQKIAEDAHKEKHLNEFWIVIASKPDINMPTVIRQGVIVTNKKPRPMLSAMCFHVVWSRGLLEPEWILPRDDGTMPFEYEDKGSEFIRNSIGMAGGTRLLI